MVRGLLSLAAVLGAALPAMAQDSDLRKEVEQLKEKVKALETEKAPAALDRDMLDVSDSTVLDVLMRETKFTGFVDVGFIFNIDRPNNAFNGNLDAFSLAGDGSVRAFDRKSRSFYLHNAQLNTSRAPTKEMIVGYNLELSFGSDANVFAAGGHGGEEDFFDVQEANVQILMPVGNGIMWTFGKFATFAGFEVIESKDNYNYSRSLPFLFAIPFTHTGARATYSFIEQVSATIGVNNGWDNVVDNNDGKTLEFNLTVTPQQWLKFLVNFYYGAEKNPTGTFDRDDGDKRMLVDLIAVIQDIPGLAGLSIALNVDIGEESDSAVSASGSVEDAEWLGFALYIRYQINEKWAGAFRYSMIDDENNFRTTGGALIGTSRDVKIDEFTFTIEYQVAKGVKARIEFRMDSASEDIFRESDTNPSGTGFDDSQKTIGGEIIVEF